MICATRPGRHSLNFSARSSGEQFDPLLGIYYNRARYYDQRQGRFWSVDVSEGDTGSPASLHKYLYASANAANRLVRIPEQSDHDSWMIAITIPA